MQTAKEEIRKIKAELAAVHRELELRNRQIERAAQLKEEFLASLSHDLRRPLTTLIGFSELLAQETAGPLNEKQKRYAEHVLTSARQLLQLIDDLLDPSKIDAGQAGQRRENFPQAGAPGEVHQRNVGHEGENSGGE